MTQNNNKLNKAHTFKNNEFYTQLSDIESELIHYKKYFEDKIVLCNCDNPNSNFIKYFTDNFKELKLKKLIVRDGDFRNQENIEVLQRADIVVTNPPFSLFREFITQLLKHEKQFLIIGPKVAINYNAIFKLVYNNKLRLGYEFKGGNGKFMTDTGIKSVGVYWYTNMPVEKQYVDLICHKKYTQEEYPKFDNYDAINVNKLEDIPMDYDGLMGVPITIMMKYNPNQFEVVDGIKRYSLLDGPTNETRGKFLTQIGDKKHFTRIIIRHKLLSSIHA